MRRGRLIHYDASHRQTLTPRIDGPNLSEHVIVSNHGVKMEGEHQMNVMFICSTRASRFLAPLSPKRPRAGRCASIAAPQRRTLTLLATSSSITSGSGYHATISPSGQCTGIRTNTASCHLLLLGHVYADEARQSRELLRSGVRWQRSRSPSCRAIFTS